MLSSGTCKILSRNVQKVVQNVSSKEKSGQELEVCQQVVAEVMNGIKKVECITGTTNKAIGRPLKTWTEHTGPRSIYILVGLIARPTAGNPYYTVTFSLKMLFLNNPFPITSSFISRWHSTDGHFESTVSSQWSFTDYCWASVTLELA